MNLNHRENISYFGAAVSLQSGVISVCKAGVKHSEIYVISPLPISEKEQENKIFSKAHHVSWCALLRFGIAHNLGATNWNNLSLASTMQTPKWKNHLLHRRCKRQNGKNTPCIGDANAKTEKIPLASAMQTPKRKKYPLHRRCKRQNGKFTSCIGDASNKIAEITNFK